MDMIPDSITTRRAFWVEHRIEAYIGARCLTNRAWYSSAFMLAAYAVEFSLKQLLCEHFDFDDDNIKAIRLNDGKTVVMSHDLEAIYSGLVEKEILDDILSKKFLRELTTEAYRYPAQKILEWNRARSRGEPQVPLIMYHLDSVFTKLDHSILTKHDFNPESNGSAFVRALSHPGYCDDYFSYNIHARHYFDEYAKILGGHKLVCRNGMHELNDIDRDNLYWNDNGDIKKDWEPTIPDLTADIAKYDDLSF